MARAKLILAEAVDGALKKVPKGKAVEAGLEHGEQGTVFVMEVVSGQKHLDLEIDAATGEVLGVEQEEAEEAKKGTDEPDHEELEKEAAATSKPRWPMQSAPRAKRSRKAFDAEFRREHGKLVSEAELLDGDDVKIVNIDAKAGKMLKKNAK